MLGTNRVVRETLVKLLEAAKALASDRGDEAERLTFVEI
jgi:hypothetical protein